MSENKAAEHWHAQYQRVCLEKNDAATRYGTHICELEESNEDLSNMVRWAYSKLHQVNFASLDDAIMLDTIKQHLTRT